MHAPWVIGNHNLNALKDKSETSLGKYNIDIVFEIDFTGKCKQEADV